MYESYAEQRLLAKHHPVLDMLTADISLRTNSSVIYPQRVAHHHSSNPSAAALRRCYRGFGKLSVLNEQLGLRAGYTKGGKKQHCLVKEHVQEYTALTATEKAGRSYSLE